MTPKINQKFNSNTFNSTSVIFKGIQYARIPTSIASYLPHGVRASNTHAPTSTTLWSEGLRALTSCEARESAAIIITGG